MFSPLRGFHFKPSEEEQQMRAKLEEERKRQSGIDVSSSGKHSKRNSQSVSISASSNNSIKDVIETPKSENKTPQFQPTETTTIRSKIESSAYYFSKSTDPEKAKQFQPKKVDEQTIKVKEEQTPKVGSLWNTGSTMEEYDYSEWIHQRLKEELLKVTFEGAPIKIEDVESVGGAATYLFARGKLRAGWDLNFKAKWKGKVNNVEVEGTVTMEDITDSDDPEEWGFYVDTQKSQSEDSKARQIVKQEKNKLLDAIGIVLDDFKSKKKTIK